MNYKIVVNRQQPYQSSDFANCRFVSFTNVEGVSLRLEKKTYQAYIAFKKALESKNIFIEIISGYRSFEEQQALIDDFTRNFGKMYVTSYVAPVTCSEHHTGLCFDIGFLEEGTLICKNEILLSSKYNETFATVHSLLASFGFILRYPLRKEEITGYSYEPWHFRYVGKATAQILKSHDLVLEEYDTMYHRSGVLIVNKPKGMTSREVVNQISKIYDTPKVGHNGTLDPLATGVLVVTIGKATKINELLTASDKEYIATVVTGYQTDTLDVEGNVLLTDASYVTEEELAAVFEVFPRTYMQEVPIYSAVKVAGKKLYEYARASQTVSLPKHTVTLKELTLLEVQETMFRFKTVVTKGTYIRSLIRDLGVKLNKLLTMQELVRTRQGQFSLRDAIPLNEVTITTPLLPLEKVLPYPVIELTTTCWQKVQNGQWLENKDQIEEAVLFTYGGKVKALYQVKGTLLKPWKMFL